MANPIVYRNYPDYESYIKHQAAKLQTGIAEFKAAFNQRLSRIVDRLGILTGGLPRSPGVLCLGARLGEEVVALRQLGFVGAKGIDLYPGESNPYVTVGDFHSIPAADSSLCIVYTNCLDHSFDLDKVIGQVVRVLMPGGYFLLELSTSMKLTTRWKDKRGRSHVELGNFESMIWASPSVVIDKISESFTLERMVPTSPDFIGAVFRRGQ